MSAVVLPEGELALLKQALNMTLTCFLFTDNVTPAKTGTGSAGTDYTEATGGGYSAQTLNYGGLTTSGATPTSAAYPAVNFTFTGSLTGNPSIYGYGVRNAAGKVLWAELASSTFTPSTVATSYIVNVNISDQ